MLNNKKGFTLIEIISVIVIIGIFLLITFPMVSNAIITVQLKYYVNQENTLLISGRNYFTIDRNRLPQNIGEEKTVTLTTLLAESYLKPIVDIKNNNCHFDESYVTVKNISKEEYQYDVRLVCNEYDTLTALGEWSDWQIEEPTGDNIDVQSAIFYNYQTPTEYAGAWTDWSDEVAFKDDTLRQVANIIGSETENRTVYRYKDQQWKWYKVDTENSGCVTSNPGAGWVFKETGSCPQVDESTGSCLASAPDGTYSVEFRCVDPSPPSNNGTCDTSSPSSYPGGTWSRGSVCDSDTNYYCADSSVYFLVRDPNPRCMSEMSIFTDSSITATCSGGTWSLTENSCSGNCNAPCPWGTKTGSTLYYNDCPSGSCTSGSTTCSKRWSAYCVAYVAAVADTTYSYTYTWTATPTYVWKRTVNSGIYSRVVNTYNSSYSSTEPTGYPNKDVAQKRDTAWTSWDINVPTSYSYRTVEPRLQTRTRNIIRDWSGNVLEDYLSETDLVTILGKSLSELSADQDIKLVTQTMYRYRIKRI